MKDSKRAKRAKAKAKENRQIRNNEAKPSKRRTPLFMPTMGAIPFEWGN